MTLRLKVVHTTRYDYDSPITSSYNEARQTPQTNDSQTTLESTVRIDPGASVIRYWDYWGSQVTAFDLHAPHERLEVVTSSLVETSPPPPEGGVFLDWAGLRAATSNDEYAELLAPTAYTHADPRLAEAAAAVAGQPDPLSAVHAASDLVRGHLAYKTGSTGVRTTAAEAWEAATGVCQDFAHITLTLLRGAGVPARYVSGYLHPSEDAEPGSTVHGQSHAWLEAWVGHWTAIDPTNNGAVGERHVLVARGRDYRDVSPLRGIYAGSARATLTVLVEITRLR